MTVKPVPRGQRPGRRSDRQDLATEQMWQQGGQARAQDGTQISVRRLGGLRAIPRDGQVRAKHGLGPGWGLGAPPSLAAPVW